MMSVTQDVVLGMLPCSSKEMRSVTLSSLWILSPAGAFYSGVSPISVLEFSDFAILTNLCILFTFLLLHFSVYKLSVYCRNKHDDSIGVALFPNLSLILLQILQQGLSVFSTISLSNLSVPSIVIGVLGTITVWTPVALVIYFITLGRVPQMKEKNWTEAISFEMQNIDEDSANQDYRISQYSELEPEQSFKVCDVFTSSTVWIPKNIVNSIGCLFSSYRYQTTSFHLVFLTCNALVGIIVGSHQTNQYCDTQTSLLLCVFVIQLLLLSMLLPFRLRVITIAFALINAIYIAQLAMIADGKTTLPEGVIVVKYIFQVFFSLFIMIATLIDFLRWKKELGESCCSMPLL